MPGSNVWVTSVQLWRKQLWSFRWKQTPQATRHALTPDSAKGQGYVIYYDYLFNFFFISTNSFCFNFLSKNSSYFKISIICSSFSFVRFGFLCLLKGDVIVHHWYSDIDLHHCDQWCRFIDSIVQHYVYSVIMQSILLITVIRFKFTSLH